MFVLCEVCIGYRSCVLLTKCCYRLLDSFQDNLEAIHMIAANGLIKNILYLITPGSSAPLISTSTYTMNVRLLAAVSHSSNHLGMASLGCSSFSVVY